MFLKLLKKNNNCLSKILGAGYGSESETLVVTAKEKETKLKKALFLTKKKRWIPSRQTNSYPDRDPRESAQYRYTDADQ